MNNNSHFLSKMIDSNFKKINYVVYLLTEVVINKRDPRTRNLDFRDCLTVQYGPVLYCCTGTGRLGKFLVATLLQQSGCTLGTREFRDPNCIFKTND